MNNSKVTLYLSILVFNIDVFWHMSIMLLYFNLFKNIKLFMDILNTEHVGSQHPPYNFYITSSNNIFKYLWNILRIFLSFTSSIDTKSLDSQNSVVYAVCAKLPLLIIIIICIYLIGFVFNVLYIVLKSRNEKFHIVVPKLTYNLVNIKITHRKKEIFLF